jgi:hypothetical protein
MGMIVVKLMGGLGNQMFQYALGKSLANKLHYPLFLDVDFLLDRTYKKDFVYRDFDLDIFKIPSFNFFDSKAKKQFQRSHHFFPFFKLDVKNIMEESFAFDANLHSLHADKIYLDGYWQSYRYFDMIASEVREDFEIKQSLTSIQHELFQKINSSTSICINFRRTDFVTIPSAIQTHGTPSMEYYHKAIQLLEEKLGNDMSIFVFSDDIDWCQRNFKSKHPTFYVGHDLYKGDRFSAYLKLMIACKHFIIPNSTFAWWAAWLANNEDKVVITPKQWFIDPILQSQSYDLRPENWIKLTI